MNVADAVSFLGLTGKGPAGKVRGVDPFGQAAKAGRVWRQSVVRIGTDHTTLERDLAVAHADEKIMKAWETVTHLWCRECQAVCLKEHWHCPSCHGIMTRKEKKRLEPEVVEVMFTCHKCGRKDVDLLD
jgi:DnaJ-class molecular chaperone